MSKFNKDWWTKCCGTRKKGVYVSYELKRKFFAHVSSQIRTTRLLINGLALQTTKTRLSWPWAPRTPGLSQTCSSNFLHTSGTMRLVLLFQHRQPTPNSFAFVMVYHCERRDDKRKVLVNMKLHYEFPLIQFFSIEWACRDPAVIPTHSNAF